MNNIHKNYPHSEYTRELYQPSGEVHIQDIIVGDKNYRMAVNIDCKKWETQRTSETLLFAAATCASQLKNK